MLSLRSTSTTINGSVRPSVRLASSFSAASSCSAWPTISALVQSPEPKEFRKGSKIPYEQLSKPLLQPQDETGGDGIPSLLTSQSFCYRSPPIYIHWLKPLTAIVLHRRRRIPSISTGTLQGGSAPRILSRNQIPKDFFHPEINAAGIRNREIETQEKHLVTRPKVEDLCCFYQFFSLACNISVIYSSLKLLFQFWLFIKLCLPYSFFLLNTISYHFCC